MARVIELESTFRKLIPTIETRLAGTEVEFRGEGLEFVTDIGSVCLQQRVKRLILANANTKSKVRIDQPDLVQLLFGYRSVEDLLIEREIQVIKKHTSAVSALFPKQNPYMWWCDRY